MILVKGSSIELDGANKLSGSIGIILQKKSRVVLSEFIGAGVEVRRANNYEWWIAATASHELRVIKL